MIRSVRNWLGALGSHGGHRLLWHRQFRASMTGRIQAMADEEAAFVEQSGSRSSTSTRKYGGESGIRTAPEQYRLRHSHHTAVLALCDIHPKFRHQLRPGPTCFFHRHQRLQNDIDEIGSRHRAGARKRLREIVEHNLAKGGLLDAATRLGRT